MKCRSLALCLALAGLSGNALSSGIKASPTTQQGWRLEQQGDINGAIEAYSRAIQVDPNDWLAHLRRGLMYMKQGQSEKMIADFSEYVRLKPDVADSWATRASAYQQRGQYRESVADIEKALSLANLPLYHFVHAQGLYYLGRYAEAGPEAEKASGVGDPGQERTAWLIHAASLAYTRQPEKSVAAFDKYVAHYHEAPAAYFLFPEGVARYQAGQLDRARQIAEQLRSSGAIPQYHYDADHPLQMFDMDASRAGAVEAVAAAEKEKAAGHLMDAFKALDHAWGTAPGITPEDGTFRQKIYSEIIALYPQMPEKPALPEEARRFFVMAKGSVRDAAGQEGYQKALGHYNTLLAMAPWYPPAYYNAALLRAGTGDYVSAVRDMKTYLQLEPNTEDTRKLTDQIYEWEAKAQ